MAKYFNTDTEHSRLIAKLKEFRMSNDSLKHLRDYQIAEQIGWTSDKLSKALNPNYSIGLSIQLRDVFIDKYNATLDFFALDNSFELRELTEKYISLKDNYQLQIDIFEAQDNLYKQEVKLYNLRLEKLKELSETERFKIALSEESPNGILHTILKIFNI